jgi:O-antigen/teichoic acid export membrane protein
MFWRGVLGYLPVNIVQAISGFGAIVLFTRLLSPTDYGGYALAFSVTTLLNTCLYTWIEASMARFHAVEAQAGDDAAAALFATLYRTFAVMAATAPILGGAALAFMPIAGSLKIAVACGLVGGGLRSLLKLAQERRRAAGEVAGYAVYDMAQTGGGFVVGAALACVGVGAASPLLGGGLASAACLIFALPGELKRVQPSRFDRARLATYLAYGLPLSLSLLMSLALSTTDRFVLAGFMNEASVGAYHAGYSLANRTLDVMFVWLGMAGGPACILAFERGGERALMGAAREQASFMLLVALPASAGLALTAKPLADLMIGPALRTAAAQVTPWIALSALFAGFTTYYLNTAFVLAKRTRLLLWALGLPAVANLGLTLALIPRFGLNGAVWATTAAYALGMVMSYGLSRRILALPIPWNALARSGAATLVMALVVWRLPAWGGVAELAVKACVGALTYGAAALAFNAGNARDHGQRVVKTLKLRLAAG